MPRGGLTLPIRRGEDLRRIRVDSMHHLPGIFGAKITPLFPPHRIFVLFWRGIFLNRLRRPGKTSESLDTLGFVGGLLVLRVWFRPLPLWDVKHV